MPAVTHTENKRVIFLPRRIWRRIFRLALHPDPQCHQTRVEILESITHTCSIWRRIAIKAAQLWTTIEVEVNPPGWGTEFSFYPRTELVNLWLKRSKNSALNIIVRRRGSQEEHRWFPLPYLYDHSDFMSLLSMLFENLVRWRRAAISGIPSFDSLCLSVFDTTQHGAPILESLRIDTCLQGTEEDETLFPYRLWRTAPRLRELSFSWANLDIQTRPMRDWATTVYIPFHQLTHLELDSCEWGTVSVSEVIFILENAPYLTVFEVNQIKNSDEIAEIDETYTHLTLPYLMRLSLYGTLDDMSSFKGYSLVKILDRFTMPCLTSLAIGRVSKWRQEEFTSFIERSGCRLGGLIFSQTRLTSLQFKNCLLLCPDLKVVHLSTWRDMWILDRTIINALNQWDGKKKKFKVCPNLEDMSFQMMHLPAENEKVFTTMINRRFNPPVGKGYFKRLHLSDESLAKRLDNFWHEDLVGSTVSYFDSV